MDTKGSPPTHSISLPEQIITFELSSYEWSQNLVCIALMDKLILGSVRFPVGECSLVHAVLYRVFLFVCYFFFRKKAKMSASSGIS